MYISSSPLLLSVLCILTWVLSQAVFRGSWGNSLSMTQFCEYWDHPGSHSLKVFQDFRSYPGGALGERVVLEVQLSSQACLSMCGSSSCPLPVSCLLFRHQRHDIAKDLHLECDALCLCLWNQLYSSFSFNCKRHKMIAVKLAGSEI